MKMLSVRLKIISIVALASFLATAAQAQDQITNVPAAGSPGTVANEASAANVSAIGGTGDSSTMAAGGSAALTLEPDLSAFNMIERGDTIGSATTSGFGLGLDGSTGAGGAGGASGIGGGGLGGIGGLGGLGGLNSLFGGAFGAGSQASKPIIRTRIRSRVSVAPMQPALVQQQASVHLGQVTGEREFRGLNVQMYGRTAVLTGTVANESDRRMSELLLRLEPGVSKVDNRVVVSSYESSSSPSDR